MIQPDHLPFPKHQRCPRSSACIEWPFVLSPSASVWRNVQVTWKVLMVQLFDHHSSKVFGHCVFWYGIGLALGLDNLFFLLEDCFVNQESYSSVLLTRLKVGSSRQSTAHINRNNWGQPKVTEAGNSYPQIRPRISTRT